jgi:hypothetical protein
MDRQIAEVGVTADAHIDLTPPYIPSSVLPTHPTTTTRLDTYIRSLSVCSDEPLVDVIRLPNHHTKCDQQVLCETICANALALEHNKRPPRVQTHAHSKEATSTLLSLAELLFSWSSSNRQSYRAMLSFSTRFERSVISSNVSISSANRSTLRCRVFTGQVQQDVKCDRIHTGRRCYRYKHYCHGRFSKPVLTLLVSHSNEAIALHGHTCSREVGVLLMAPRQLHVTNDPRA